MVIVAMVEELVDGAALPALKVLLQNFSIRPQNVLSSFQMMVTRQVLWMFGMNYQSVGGHFLYAIDWDVFVIFAFASHLHDVSNIIQSPLYNFLDCSWCNICYNAN